MSRDAARAAARSEIDRWEQQLTDELLRVFDRQEAVVLARLQGTKARKHTRHWEPPGERKIDPAYVLDPARWLLDAVGSVSPTLRRLYVEVYDRVTEKVAPAEPPPAAAEPPAAPAPPAAAAPPSGGGTGGDGGVSAAAVAAGALALAASGARRAASAAGDLVAAALGARESVLERRIQRRLDLIATGVRTAAGEVQQLIADGEADGLTMPQIADAVRELYARRKPLWAARIATVNTTAAINEAGLEGAVAAGARGKQWLSSRDDRVRDTHEHADGQVRGIAEPFRLGGIPSHPLVSLLQYPGDPSAPADEVIGCRCSLLFTRAAG